MDVDTSAGPDALRYQATHQGTALRMDVEDPTPRIRAGLERNDCTGAAGFSGLVSTLGTGSTGPIQVRIGDGSRVPSLAGVGLDARCIGGQASLVYQSSAAESNTWDVGECATEYEFDARRNGMDYYVETDDGFLRSHVALQSQNEGRMAFAFTDGEGVSHGASDRLRVLREEVTFPSCQQFRDSPVEWYTLNARDVPGDLMFNMNPQQGPLGNLSTLTVQSPAGARSGVVELFAHLQSQPDFTQSQEARLFALSPVDVLDAYIGSGQQAILRDFPDTDGFQFVWEDQDIHWHLHFEGVKEIRGSADRQCRSMQFDVAYERQSGWGERVLKDYVRLGPECETLLLELDVPETFEYTVDWNHLLDIDLQVIESSEVIEHLSIDSNGACMGDTCNGFQSSDVVVLEVDLYDIPADELFVRSLVLGIETGILQLQSDGGAVGKVHMGLSANGDPKEYLRMDLENVDVWMEWDLDGDTRYGNNPFFFVDTKGTWMDFDARIRSQDLGFGIFGYVMTEEAQFVYKPKLRLQSFNPFNGESVEERIVKALFRVNGEVCGTGSVQALFRGDWKQLPFAGKFCNT